MTAGTEIEVGFQTNDSDRVSQIEKNGVVDNHFHARHFNLFLDSKKYGRASIGLGWTASGRTSFQDLSNTFVIGRSSVRDMAGGHFFYDSNTGSLSDTTVNEVFDNMNGLGRDDRAVGGVIALRGGHGPGPDPVDQGAFDVDHLAGPPGVVDRGLDLAPMADDPGVAEEPFDVGRAEAAGSGVRHRPLRFERPETLRFP